MRADVERAIKEFEASARVGVFPRIPKEDLIRDLRATVANPLEVHQGRTAFCGPAAIVHTFVTRQPRHYVEVCRELYETGSFQAGGGQVEPSRAFRASPSPAGISPADWMLMGAMRDAENAIFPVESTSGPIVQGITTPWEMKGWAGTLLGCSSRQFTSTFVYGEFDAMRAAQAAVSAGGAAYLMVDAAMLGGSATVAIPNHWIEFLGGLAIDPGTWWKIDSGHIRFECYSWGQKIVVDRGEGSFEDYMWGVVLGEHATLEPDTSELLLAVEPTHLPCTAPATFIVRANDSLSRKAVQGDVYCAGSRIGGTADSITTTIGGRWVTKTKVLIEPPEFRRRIVHYRHFQPNQLFVKATGYPDAQVPVILEGVPRDQDDEDE